MRAVGKNIGVEGVKVEKANGGILSGIVEGGSGQGFSVFDCEEMIINGAAINFAGNGILFDTSDYCKFSGISKDNGNWGVRGTGDYNLVDGAVLEGNSTGETALAGANSAVNNTI